MKTIDDIVAAASTLDPRQLLRLRKKLDRLEDRIWQGELAVVTRKLKNAGITEEEIDRRVVRRRRESRT